MRKRLEPRRRRPAEYGVVLEGVAGLVVDVWLVAVGEVQNVSEVLVRDPPSHVPVAIGERIGKQLEHGLEREDRDQRRQQQE